MRINKLKTERRVPLKTAKFDKLCEKSKLRIVPGKHYSLFKKVMDETMSQLLYVLLLPVVIFIKVDTMLDKMSKVHLKKDMEELDDRIYSS